jgi:L-fuculose-phosphate aldolase
MNASDVRFRIAAARRMLYREGCDSTVGGHVSARDEDGKSFWVNPFEYFDETTPDRCVRLDFDLKPLGGEWETSPAVAFHAALYRGRPDVNCVIHTHSHYVCIVATKREPIGNYGGLSVLFHDDQTFYEDDGVSHPPVYGPKLLEVLGEKGVVWIKSHGAILVGDTLENTTIRAMSLETAARYHFEARLFGGTEMAEPQAVRSRVSYYKYYLPQMWAANLRRLRKSDPELFEFLDEEAAPRRKKLHR